MTEESSKIIPNSYQTPNYLVDVLMRLLSGNEQKCLDVVCRKTFGWQKRSDRISKSQLMELTGLGEKTVDRCMAELVKYRIVLRLSESIQNKGVEWSVQIIDRLIDLKGLQERTAKRFESNRKRTTKALVERKVGMSNIPPQVGTSNIPPGGMSNVPHKSHYQKPESSSSTGEAEPILIFYKQEFGKVTPTIREKLITAKETYSEEWVLEALTEAVTYNKPSWAYADAILKRWQQEGKTKTKGVNHHANSQTKPGATKAAKRTPTEPTPADLEAARRIMAKRQARANV